MERRALSLHETRTRVVAPSRDSVIVADPVRRVAPRDRAEPVDESGVADAPLTASMRTSPTTRATPTTCERQPSAALIVPSRFDSRRSISSCDGPLSRGLATAGPYRRAAFADLRSFIPCASMHRSSSRGAPVHIDKDLVAASATPLVLAILAEGESYGYAILKRVRALSAGELEWTDGMLYPLLHRLGRLGYVTTDWRTPPEGRRRKYYALTDDGRAALADQQRQWMTVNRALNDVWRLSAVGEA